MHMHPSQILDPTDDRAIVAREQAAAARLHAKFPGLPLATARMIARGDYRPDWLLDSDLEPLPTLLAPPTALSAQPFSLSEASVPFGVGRPSPRVQVLAVGTFRDMHGETIQVTPALIAQLADSYDPRLYAAPVVIGHPQHNSPRFGTLISPSASVEHLEVGLADLDPEFVTAHRQGRYPQRSLSFWPAGHPDNPLPLKDRAYIRHLGFLGAQPPAIKGLRGADLAEGW